MNYCSDHNCRDLISKNTIFVYKFVVFGVFSLTICPPTHQPLLLLMNYCQFSLFHPGAFPQNVFLQHCPSILTAVSQVTSLPVNLSGTVRLAWPAQAFNHTGKWRRQIVYTNLIRSYSNISKYWQNKKTKSTIRFVRNIFFVEHFPKKETIASILCLSYAFTSFSPLLLDTSSGFPSGPDELKIGT